MMPAELVRLLDIITAVIEILGVSVLLSGFLISSWRYLRHHRQMARPDLVQEFRRGLGRTVLVGLEILVAAVIVKTISVKPTLVSIGLLAGMIAVRTIIGWTMALEIDGHWPWQKEYRNPSKQRITSTG
jgi:uncharacterized membrane protein